MLFLEKTKEVNLFKRLDYTLIIPVILITILGYFVVHSATFTMSSGNRIVLMQGIGIGLGLICMLCIAFIDYKDFKILGGVLYVVSIALLILVLMIGQEQSGGKSWLRVAGVSFQPSELTKISFIIMASAYMEKIKNSDWVDLLDILKLFLISSVPIILVILQRDFGTALVFIAIMLSLLFIYGIQYRYFLYMGVVGIASSIFSWYFVLNEARKDRIRVFLNPEMDTLGAGYNVISSKRAIGSGEFFGSGLFNGIQTQNAVVPVKESDFIFSVIGEELGFIGCMVVIVFISWILLRCLYIASLSRDKFGAYIVTGITGMYAAHFFENIGMTIGLLPVTGIPLPFISAGGSAILANFIGMGVILSVSIRRRKELFK